MSTNLPPTWPIARYRLDFRVQEKIFWPDYAGSAIRGAFGHALRKTACMTHMGACLECPLYRTCPYVAIFESVPPAEHTLQKFSQIPHPYVIEAPSWGRHESRKDEVFSFHVVLIGKALNQLPLIIYALQRAFSREILKGSARLEKVFVEHSHEYLNIYDSQQTTVAPHVHEMTLPDLPIQQNVRLRFSTPLRLQNNGRNLGINEILPSTLLNALMRRVSLLMEFHANRVNLDFPHLAEMARCIRFTNELQWLNWKRFSSRQNQKMHMGGVVGDLVLYDVPRELLALLHVGQWTHVGRNAVFGLGHYDIVSI